MQALLTPRMNYRLRRYESGTLCRMTASTFVKAVKIYTRQMPPHCRACCSESRTCCGV